MAKVIKPNSEAYQERAYKARQLKPAAPGESRVYKHQQSAPQEWVDSGARVRVRSSNVLAIRYDKPNQILYVEFKKHLKGKNKNTDGVAGKLYRYFGVHPLTAKSMYQSASMGKFVWYKLRDRYPYEPL